MEYLIKGGTLFFASGLTHKQDIWVKEGRIHVISDRIKDKPGATVIDGQGFGVFPGLVYEQPLWPVLRNHKRYREKFLELFHFGFTTVVDVIPWYGQMPFSRWIDYYISLHANSPFDLAFQVLIPVQLLTPQIVKCCGQHQIRQMILLIDQPIHLKTRDWDRIVRCKENYGIYLWIYPSRNWAKGLDKNATEEVLNYWDHVENDFRISAQKKSPFSATFPRTTPLEYVEEFTRLFSCLPAKRAGIFPEKGRLAPGSVADLVMVPLRVLMERKKFVPHMIFLKGKPYILPVEKLPMACGKRLATRSAFAFQH